MPLAAQLEPAIRAADPAAALPTATHDHLLLTLLDPKVSLLDLIENVEGFTITHFLAWFQSPQIQATVAALTSFYSTRAALLSLAGIDRAVESLAALTEQPIPEAASPELQARWRESTRKAAAALLRQAKTLAPSTTRQLTSCTQSPTTPAFTPSQKPSPSPSTSESPPLASHSSSSQSVIRDPQSAIADLMSPHFRSLRLPLFPLPLSPQPPQSPDPP